ncbi:MAG: hypothetical protein J6V40_03180 [Clostridia bacterium]|nr:hypothetical protein [Clostridia bacterium]
MISNTFQLNAALILCLLGILAGVIDRIVHPKIVVSKIRLYSIICDATSIIIAATLLTIGVNIVAKGVYRLYLVVFFITGYIIEQKTIDKLFAKICSFVYNLLSRVISFVCKTNIFKLISK